MLNQIFLALPVVFSLGVFLMALRSKSNTAADSLLAAEERALWAGIEAGFFDSSEISESSRLEIALAAIAAKLKLRVGMVTIHGKDSCEILAISNSLALRGLKPGQRIARDSTYCGQLSERGNLLSITSAGDSEWKTHKAFYEQGWRAYIGVNCGLIEGEDAVVAFFDSLPRKAPFTAEEKILVEQVAPWVAAMVGKELDNKGGESESLYFSPKVGVQGIEQAMADNS